MNYKLLSITALIALSYGQMPNVRPVERAQSTKVSSRTINDKLPSLDEEIYLENTIDPENYIVGPGDEFTFNMVSSDGVITIPLKVSPTGDVLIPTVGVVKVDKLTLKQAFDEIHSRCIEKYNNAKINFNLTGIRKFKIQVIGTIKHPGFVVVSPISRVSDVYKIVKDDDDRPIDEQVSKSNDAISIRHITLWRSGTPHRVDLVKYNMYGINGLNPNVQQGDVIEFQLKKEEVGLYGGVGIPGKYEYVKGETIFDLIQLAGGFTKNADTNRVDITRFINPVDRKSISLNSIAAIRRTTAHPEDHILVRYIKDYKRQDLVTLVGEVKYPGVYSIDVGQTTFGAILQEAGGYASKADTTKITITNKFIENIPDVEFERISLIPHEDRSDAERAYIKARKRTSKGKIESQSPEFTHNIKSFVLSKNDIIYIPPLYEYVEVLGAVQNPGRYPIIETADINHYIAIAGGLTNTATRKKYIIKANTGLRLPFSKNSIIENGDIIFIAEKIEYNTWTRIQEIMMTLGQLATIIIVIQNAVAR